MSACLGGIYVPLFNCGWLYECILVCLRDKCGLMDVWVYVYGCYDWSFQVECFLHALIDKGLWRCSATSHPLHKSSVPQSALCVLAFGLGARALYLSQSPSFTLTLMTIPHWPLQFPLGRLPLPSLLHRLCLHTQSNAPRSTPLKPALDSQELTLTTDLLVFWYYLSILFYFLHLLGHSYQGKWCTLLPGSIGDLYVCHCNHKNGTVSLGVRTTLKILVT